MAWTSRQFPLGVMAWFPSHTSGSCDKPQAGTQQSHQAEGSVPQAVGMFLKQNYLNIQRDYKSLSHKGHLFLSVNKSSSFSRVNFHRCGENIMSGWEGCGRRSGRKKKESRVGREDPQSEEREQKGKPKAQEKHHHLAGNQVLLPGNIKRPTHVDKTGSKNTSSTLIFFS